MTCPQLDLVPLFVFSQLTVMPFLLSFMDCNYIFGLGFDKCMSRALAIWALCVCVGGGADMSLSFTTASLSLVLVHSWPLVLISANSCSRLLMLTLWLALSLL